MRFEYRVYADVLFWSPLLALAFAALVGVGLLKGIIKESKSKFSSQKLILNIFASITLIAFTLPQIIYLLNGGFILITEKNVAPEVVRGTITQITEPSTRFRGFKASPGENGADILIGENEYFAISSTDFNVGDKVEILYLPKSKIVLQINPITNH